MKRFQISNTLLSTSLEGIESACGLGVILDSQLMLCSRHGTLSAPATLLSRPISDSVIANNGSHGVNMLLIGLLQLSVIRFAGDSSAQVEVK